MGYCLDHLGGKHGGPQFLALNNLGKFFFPVDCSPDVSGIIAVDIKLFHESVCWLVHKYRIYDDPLPHRTLKNGIIKKLLGFYTGPWLLRN